MKKIMTAVTVIATTCAIANQSTSLISDGGFEETPSKWMFSKLNMSKVEKQAARTGIYGLRVTDNDSTKGSSLSSKLYPVKSGDNLELSFYSKTIEGNKGIGVYLVFLNDKKKNIPASPQKKEAVITVPANKEWTQQKLEWQAPEGAMYFKVWIHSFNAAKTIVDFDDISVIKK